MKNIKYLLLLIPLLFITKVNAASYTGFDYSAQLYDNLGPTLSAVTTSGPTSGTGAYEGYIAYAANSSGGAWGISSPITLIANHTYTLTANIPNECGTPILSSYNRIGVGTSLSNAKTSYQNNTNVTEVYSKAIGNSTYLIQYAFTPNINASFIVFPFATSVTCESSRTFLETVSIEDLGVDAVTQDEITSSLDSQTNEINTYITDSTNTITDALTETEESINNNLNEKFESCTAGGKNLYDYVNNTFTGVRYLSDGSTDTNASWKSTINYIKVDSSTTYTLSGLPESSSNYFYYIEFDSSKIFIKRSGFALSSTTKTFTTSSTTKYIKFMALTSIITPSTIQLEKGDTATDYESYQEVCTNKLDETNDKLDETNQNLNDINGALTDDDVDSTIEDGGNFFNNFSTTDHGGLSGIITAPLVAINEMLNTSCSPMTATFKGKELSLPCGYEFWNKLGAIQDFINIVLGGLLCYRIIIKLYRLIERIKNPEDDRVEVMDL